MVDFVIFVYEESIKKLNFNGKYFVIPCGIDLDLFRPMDRIRCRKDLDLPLNKKIIFFPASPTNKQKGFEILKESLLHLDEKDLHLIVGGHIPHQKVPYYMCAADVIVQLSIFEASPMVLKEAMAVNRPLVFTNTGDAKSITGNARGCFLCEREPHDVASKLREALNCNGYSEGRKQIVTKGLGLSEVARKITRVYEQLFHRTTEE